MYNRDWGPYHLDISSNWIQNIIDSRPFFTARSLADIRDPVIRVQAIPKHFGDNVLSFPVDSRLCSICQDVVDDSTKMYITSPCFHIFHVECINRSLERSGKCPNCREEITVKSRIIESIHEPIQEPIREPIQEPNEILDEDDIRTVEAQTGCSRQEAIYALQMYETVVDAILYLA